MSVLLRQCGEAARADELQPGSHVCYVVDSTADFEAWAAACLADGERRGEKLLRFGPYAALAPSPGRPPTTLADPHRDFLDHGPVDAATMLAMFRRETAAARQQGYQGLRLVADMDWLLPAAPSRVEVTAFEIQLDEVVAELGVTVVCAYRRSSFDSATVEEMVTVHPLSAGAAATGAGFRLWAAGPRRWELSGEVDYSNSELFTRALAAASDGATTLRLGVGALRFIAVSGIHAIADLAAARPGSRLVVADASAVLRRCWDLLGLDRWVPNVTFTRSATPAARGVTRTSATGLEAAQ